MNYILTYSWFASETLQSQVATQRVESHRINVSKKLLLRLGDLVNFEATNTVSKTSNVSSLRVVCYYRLLLPPNNRELSCNNNKSKHKSFSKYIINLLCINDLFN